MILDTAGAKGTGKWMSQLALDLGVPSTLVTEAVYARCLSAMKDARVRASKVLTGPTAKYDGDRKTFIEQMRQALYASKICSYAQGFVQIAGGGRGARLAAQLRQHRAAVARRLHHPGRVSWIASRKPSTPIAKLENLLLAPYFTQGGREGAGRLAARGGDGRRSWASRCRPSRRRWPTTTAIAQARLPANLLQAQRDYFGAHTYQRTDKPGAFHTDWLRAAPPAEASQIA